MFPNIDHAEGPVEIGIMYAHTCNIACRHCGILSSPHNHNRMSLQLAERCIREAAAIVPKPSTIVFTGGEPFLFVNEIEELIALCNELGLSTRVVTNGFWGQKPAIGRAILHRLRLAGLDALNFSADKYHLEFLEPSVLRNAIALAQEVGYVAIVNFVMNGPGDPVETFARLYSIPLDQIRPFREEELAQQSHTRSVPPEVYTKINLSHGRLIGLGRAAEYPDEHYLTPIESFNLKGCSEVVNRPVIYPNGDLQACCCAGGKIEAFTVGNLITASLADLVEAMRKRSHFRFINTFGPRQLYQTLCAAKAGGQKDDLHASICDMCVAATRNMKGQEIDQILEQWVLGRLLAGTSHGGD